MFFKIVKADDRPKKNLKSTNKVVFVVDKVNIQTLINIKFLIHENGYDKEKVRLLLDIS